MAMDKVTLGTLIKTKVRALSAAEAQDPDLLFQALADAIITHLQTSAQVTGSSATGGPVVGVIL
jgi:hypothetical protein